MKMSESFVLVPVESDKSYPVPGQTITCYKHVDNGQVFIAASSLCRAFGHNNVPKQFMKDIPEGINLPNRTKYALQWEDEVEELVTFFCESESKVAKIMTHLEKAIETRVPIKKDQKRMRESSDDSGSAAPAAAPQQSERKISFVLPSSSASGGGRPPGASVDTIRRVVQEELSKFTHILRRELQEHTGREARIMALEEEVESVKKSPEFAEQLRRESANAVREYKQAIYKRLKQEHGAEIEKEARAHLMAEELKRQAPQVAKEVHRQRLKHELLAAKASQPIIVEEDLLDPSKWSFDNLADVEKL